MRRRLGRALLVMALVFPGWAPAQDTETLADIRQQLAVLSVELKKLTRELSTTGSAGNVALGASLIDRTNAIESELQRLNALTEAIELRITRVTSDGSNRIGDLEFRICELEPGCDPGKLGESKPLGGAAAQAAAPPAPAATSAAPDGPALAASEQADFDRARTAFDNGDFAGAAAQMAGFVQNYPGSPLSGQAGLIQGKALKQQGDTAGAARVWLETFSADESGPQAAESVLLLGRALGELGKTREACVTLGEIGKRFAGSPEAGQAPADMQSLGCP